jgi:hypothetical protein
MWTKRTNSSENINGSYICGARNHIGHQKEFQLKKPLTLPDTEPRKIQRADVTPDEGFSLVVDGRFKTHFEDEAAAKIAAAELLSRYKMLKIEIYDASKRERTKFS